MMHTKGIDSIELYVADAPHVADRYARAFGFLPVAYAGPETGALDRRSFVLEQGRARLIITSATGAEGPIAEFVRVHGDGVRDVAVLVDNVHEAFRDAVDRGADPIAEPSTWERDGARMSRATIRGFGDVVHTLVHWEGMPCAPLPPPYQPLPANAEAAPGPFSGIDHVAMCVSPGMLDDIVDYYKAIFGFIETHEENVETPISGMSSKVVQDPGGNIKFPIQAPFLKMRSGQIEGFLANNGGPGVQHLALLTDDIVDALRWLRDRDVAPLPTPRAYHDALIDRVGEIDEDLTILRELNILVDRDAFGYLLQVFTRSLHPRKTLFFEVIQRKQARGFGGANIRALFEAVEREEMASACG